MGSLCSFIQACSINALLHGETTQLSKGNSCNQGLPLSLRAPLIRTAPPVSAPDPRGGTKRLDVQGIPGIGDLNGAPALQIFKMAHLQSQAIENQESQQARDSHPMSSMRSESRSAELSCPSSEKRKEELWPNRTWVLNRVSGKNTTYPAPVGFPQTF